MIIIHTRGRSLGQEYMHVSKDRKDTYLLAGTQTSESPVLPCTASPAQGQQDLNYHLLKGMELSVLVYKRFLTK